MPAPKRTAKKTASSSSKQSAAKKSSSSVLGEEMQNIMDNCPDCGESYENCTCHAESNESCDCKNGNCDMGGKKRCCRSNVGLIIAIIFASVIISGSAVFFAMQKGTGWWPWGQDDLYPETGGGISAAPDDAFQQKVEAAIDRYVQKKQAEQQQAQDQASKQAIDKSKEKAKAVAPVSKTVDHIYGNADAPISLVEYADFQCPYCKRFYPVAKQLVDGSNGQVNLVYRNFPLEGHEPAATQQALAAECVASLGGNDGFWKFHDVLFAKGTADEKGMTEEAVKIGMSEKAFKECYESKKFQDHIEQDTKNGLDAGVTGTPGNVLLNNKTHDAVLIEGAQPASIFQQYIKELAGN